MLTSNQKKIIIDNIMQENRHHFIYGNTTNIEEILKDIIKEYPIKVDQNIPFAININPFGFIKPETINKNIDQEIINILSNDFFNLLYTKELIKQISFQIDNNIINKRQQYFIDKVKADLLLEDEINFKEIYEHLNKIKNIYLKVYNEYMTTGNNDCLSKLPLDIYNEITYITKNVKDMLNNQSFCSVFIKVKDNMLYTENSYEVINNLISSRINKNISINILCEPEKWPTYCTSDNVYIDNIHDYGIIEIDSSHKEYIKRIKKI